MKSHFYRSGVLVFLFLLLSSVVQVFAQATLVKDINSGVKSSIINGATGFWQAAPLGNNILFNATDGKTGNALWISDGTDAGTFNMATKAPRNLPVDPQIFFVLPTIPGLVFFSALSTSFNPQFWRSDGTAAGTYDIGGSEFSGLESSNFFSIDTTLYCIISKNDGLGRRLVQKNTRSYGYKVIIDKSYSDIYSFPAEFNRITRLKNKWLFAAQSTRTGGSGSGIDAIYSSDGTKAGTVKVADLPYIYGNLYPTRSGNLVFFYSDKGTSGIELWVTDGTSAGTKMVKDIAPGSLSSSLSVMIPLQNEVLFVADDGVTGKELWISDGTEAGTRLFKEFTPGSGSSSISLYNLDDGLGYFTVSGQTWRTDGTLAGTYVLTNSLLYGSILKEGKFIYSLDKDSKVIRLDGQPNSSQTVGSITNFASLLSRFLVAGNNIFYAGYANDTGDELWKLSLCTHQATISTPNGTSFCSGSSIDLQANASGGDGSFTYKWTSGTSNLGTNAKLTVNKAGTYTVEVTDSKGCSVASSLSITQTANLPVTVTGASAICTGQTTPLSATATGGSGTYTYQWRLGNSLLPGATSSAISASVAGTYSVSVVDSKGCTGTSASMTLVQKPSPNAIITPAGTTAILSTTTVTFTTPAATGQTYQWFRDGTLIPGATNNSYVASQQGNYTVMVTLNGCSATSAAAVVSIITAIEPGETGIGMEISPNPASEVCTVKLLLDAASAVQVSILDAGGKPMRQWASGRVARSHEVTFSLSDLPAGLYLVQAIANTRKAVIKLIKD